MNTFAARLEKAMQDAGYTQASLARAVKISRAAINQVVTGQTKGLKPHHLIVVCRVLNIRPEWLALGEEPQRPELREGDRALLQHYHPLSPGQKQLVATLVNDLASKYG
jgi:transcriptional regulator with XRE-family HTH domain